MSFLLPLLDDPHPPTRYHALWAITDTRSLEGPVLAAIERQATAQIDEQSDLAVKARQIARGYLAHVEHRRGEVEQLALAATTDAATGLTMLMPPGWRAAATDAADVREKRVLTLTHPTELIQLRHEPAPEVSVVLSVSTGLEDTVEEIARANCPDDCRFGVPVVEVLGRRGEWEVVLTAHELQDTLLHTWRCFLVRGDTLVVWRASAPRADLPLWAEPLERVIRSIVPT